MVPHGGDPVLFETAGSDLQCAKIDLPWMEGRIRPAITWQWAEGAVPYMAGRMAETVMEVLKEHGVEKEKIGIDNLDMPALEAFTKLGLKIVNGWPAVSAARVVKTRDEIELLKQASSIGDAAMWKIKYEWLKPGVREREIEAKVHEFMLDAGCEIIYDIIVASGGNTSPYRRWATDKLIRQGDLRDRGHQRRRPLGLLHRLRALLQVRRRAGHEDDPEGNRPVPRSVRFDVRRHRATEAGKHHRRRGQGFPGIRRRQVRHGDPAAVRAQHRHHAVRGHVDVAGLFAEVSRRDQREHVLRHRNLRRTPQLQQTARLEENVLVTKDGPVVFTMMEHMEEAMKR